ncbi:MAG: fibronectin type III domain-containing protein [Bacteroidales bacterium]
MTWTDNATNESGFIVGRSTTSGGPYTTVGTTGANVASYTDMGLNPLTTYYYQITAQNAGGESAGLTGNATTLPNAPAARRTWCSAG